MTQLASCCSVPVCGLGGDECAQRCECRVDRIGAISLPRVGCSPLATLPKDGRPLGKEPPHHGLYIPPYAPSCPAQLPLPVHLDVKGRWRRGGQAVVGGVGGTLLRARTLAPVFIIVFGEESDVTVQEAACGRRRAQHGECHLHRKQRSVSCWSILVRLPLGEVQLVTFASLRSKVSVDAFD